VARGPPAGYGVAEGLSETSGAARPPAGYGVAEGLSETNGAARPPAGYGAGEGLAEAVGDAVPDGVADAPAFGFTRCVGDGVGTAGGGE
jgi:hypothetical protein